MSSCIIQKSTKYTLRNSPPFPANKCKSMKKKGNDGLYYTSLPDKNGVHKWTIVNLKNKTMKNANITIKLLQNMAKKYKVSKKGSKKDLAKRLKIHVSNQTDKKIINKINNE